jgi:hypothetical protein
VQDGGGKSGLRGGEECWEMKEQVDCKTKGLGVDMMKKVEDGRVQTRRGETRSLENANNMKFREQGWRLDFEWHNY